MDVRKEKCCCRRVRNIYVLYKPSGMAGLCVAVSQDMKSFFQSVDFCKGFKSQRNLGVIDEMTAK